MFSSEFSNWLLPCFSWPAITTRICGSVMRSRAAVSRSTRSPRSLVSAILRVWSMSSTMTRTCRGSIGCVTPDSLIDCIYRTHDPAGTIAVPAGPCVRRRSEPEVGFHPGVLVAGLVDRRVGVHRVVVRRAVVVHRVVVYGAVRQRRRVHRVVVHRVVGGCRRGVHDVGAVVHAVGVGAAVDARRGLVAVYRRRVAVGHRRRAVTGGLDDRAVVRGEHVALAATLPSLIPLWSPTATLECEPVWMSPLLTVLPLPRTAPSPLTMSPWFNPAITTAPGPCAVVLLPSVMSPISKLMLWLSSMLVVGLRMLLPLARSVLGARAVCGAHDVAQADGE